MSDIQFIYFDVGNTLIDCSTAFQDAATKFKLTIDDIGKVFDQNHDEITKGCISAQELWQKCTEKYNLKSSQSFNFLNSWVSDYKPINEMHKLVYKIKSKFRIGLLSNIYPGMKPLIIERGLIPKIDYAIFIFSCDVGMMKQEQDIYELAVSKAGVKADQILFVDDRQDFLENAKKIHGKTFLFDFKSSKKSAEELEGYLKTF